MQHSLSNHPATPSDIVERIEVSQEWKAPNQLWSRYHVEMPLDQLILPDPAEPERADNLWQTTCFELFLRQPGVAPYCEFNFSPSSQWAAYGFTNLREGMHEIELPADPVIGLDASETHFALEVDITLPEDRVFPQLAASISAIIVDDDGGKTFWGYAHPEGAPDFHHADCFAARLTPPHAS